MQHNLYGRQYAHLSHLRKGHKLVCDNGFDCIGDGEIKVVMGKRSLYVKCNNGQHHLNSQHDGDGYLVGMYRVQ